MGVGWDPSIGRSASSQVKPVLLSPTCSDNHCSLSVTHSFSRYTGSTHAVLGISRSVVPVVPVLEGLARG